MGNQEMAMLEIIEDDAESTPKGAVKRKYTQVETIVNLNAYFRVKISSLEFSMFLEKKRVYDDGSFNWIDDGSFGSWIPLIKDVKKSMIKEHLLKKSVNDLTDLQRAMQETEKTLEKWYGFNPK